MVLADRFTVSIFFFDLLVVLLLLCGLASCALGMSSSAVR